MIFAQYGKLFNWTNRQPRKDKAGAISADWAPVPERLEYGAEMSVDLVRNIWKRFFNEAGLPNALQSFRLAPH